MSHSTTWWRGLAGDETDDGLLHLLLHITSGVLLVGAADLAHHANDLRVGIGLERRQAVDEVRAVDRVTTDTNARRLPKTGTRELVDHFIGQCARAAHDADRSWRNDARRDDADLRLSRGDESRAIRAD